MEVLIDDGSAASRWPFFRSQTLPIFEGPSCGWWPRGSLSWFQAVIWIRSYLSSVASGWS